jgi:hypothetical protein
MMSLCFFFHVKDGADLSPPIVFDVAAPLNDDLKQQQLVELFAAQCGLGEKVSTEISAVLSSRNSC